ncbi:PPOX class F420-dependent oxidoreductase [Streptomyces lunaelactis]|uniref:PPOX class F420-dependent oxidoreductase n=1 Tax=Streptomyces lunaelactis TaxID=1535768 RepID=UPI0015851A1B|nr:PPOX class F420-dependent oxidoreductase [Streptomyces lunaelactis]NUK01203.1 PPOX class F420-dependent oxidoreductase [Streptomyces lunaelactis]NUK15146.1 PPOX class F420-dependent oxidoreductase [Streptomyces lunaelactis]NUK23232.1 PPOX class F420-dependent oxidoreductase [Streptomyces lunaelactis]
MAAPMTDAEWRTFVSRGTRTAKIATTRADGRPHVAPVWFLLDGGDLVFNTGKDSVKGRTLIRDGRLAICVDDDQAPFSFVIINGRAKVSEDMPQVRDWATRIAARYVGEDHAAEYGVRNGGPGSLLVRVSIDRVLAVRGISD